MKTAEIHTTATQHRPETRSAEGPFFQRDAERGFFGGDRTAEPFFSPATIQPKLKIGAPDDAYEKEADQVADQVVQRLASPGALEPEVAPARPVAKTQSVAGAATATATPLARVATPEAEEELQTQEEEGAAPIRRKAIFDSAGEEEGVQRKCAACEAEEGIQPKRMPAIQRSGDGSLQASDDFSSRLQRSKGGGSPMSSDTRNSMEGAMGADFSGVRVHTGSEAASLSNDIGAQAFTHGSDVYFNDNKYDPGSSSGQHLLAHELTHTVQQGGAFSTDNIDNKAENTNEKKEVVSNEQPSLQKRDRHQLPTSGPAKSKIPNDSFFTPTERGTEKDKGQFEQENKSEVKEQLRKETNQAASESPVEAKIEEGEPTILLPEKEESESDKKIELQEQAKESPVIDQQAGKEKNKDKEKPKAKHKKENTKKPKKKPTGRKEILVDSPMSLPAIEPDGNVAAIQNLGNQEPSDSDLEEHRKDTRSDEEKIAEQRQIASQFRAQYQSIRSNVQQKIIQETNSIRLQEQSVSDAVRQDTIAKATLVQAIVSSQKAALQTAYQQSQAMLLANKEIDFIRLEAVKRTKTEELSTEMEARRSGFNAFVDEQTNMPTVNANSEADRADRELEAAAEEALAEGESVARQHPGSDDGNPDAREAVRGIARETAADMRGSKETIREDLLNLAAEFNGGFEDYRVDITGNIDSTEEQLLSAINDATENFRGIIEDTYNSVSESLTEKEQDDLNKLDELQTTQLDALNENEQIGLNSIKQAADTTVGEIQRTGTYSLKLIDNLANNTTQLLTPDGSIPIISAVWELQQNGITQLQELEQQGVTQLDSISIQGFTAIENTQEANRQANSSISTTVSQQSNELLATSNTQREDILANLRTTMNTSFTSLEDALDQMRTEALGGIDEAIEERKNNILQANEEFLAELISQNDENIQTAKQPLTDPLSDRLWSAADRATASWWEGLLAAVVDLIVMLVILVAFAAILVFFGVFSTITGALLAIGVLLLAVIFIVSLVGRLMDGHGWSSLPLAIADTLGITMIYQGVTNRNIATGEDLGMNTFDRWYSGTSGTLQFILILSPLKSRIPGIRNIRFPKSFGRLPGVRGIGRGIGRFVKWIEGRGGRFRTWRNKGIEPNRPPIGDRMIDWFKSRWPFRNRQNEEGGTTEPLRGRRPQNPEQPVLDENGQLTDYGRWYYERPGNYRNRAELEQEIWEQSLGEDGVARGPNGEELSPNNWKFEPSPGNELPQIQQRAAEGGYTRRQFLDELNNPENYRATVRNPNAQFSGRRPTVPDQALFDPQTGELTPYGRWYYERPSGFRHRVREQVWRNAEESSIDGIVRDRLTQQEMNPNEPWDMGHRYGFEFSKHRVSAARRGIGRNQYIEEYNTVSHYEPELPASNSSHAGEAGPGIYYGP